MRTARRIDRREFLRRGTFAALAGSGATAPTRLPFGAGGPAHACERYPQDLVRSIFSDPGGAALVGSVFLEANPHEADRSKLLDRTVRNAWEKAAGPHSAAALRSALRARIRADLIASRTTRVGGWILSITEARLCALAFMLVLPTSEIA